MTIRMVVGCSMLIVCTKPLVDGCTMRVLADTFYFTLHQ